MEGWMNELMNDNDKVFKNNTYQLVSPLQLADEWIGECMEGWMNELMNDNAKVFKNNTYQLVSPL